ncbi:phage holin family protein [Mangrovibacillus cuniculi]|uniref:Phage holin family protein n=1 Tax=Mangrovibacillus cuniculi TaxID=2593652 RepID=A0A7S8HG37_9BACI|nr:phage holin family protein [Mangrovibacillus cuniculi]QPC47468.1 phage holin family protein [Mangrovibacillus cuniculi]
MKWIVGILFNAAIFLGLAGFFEGVFISSVTAAVLASVVLSIVNVVVRPLLIIFTLPITLITLGFFLLVINTFSIMITDWLMGDAFNVDGFWLSFLIAIILSLMNTLFQQMVYDRRKS